VQLRLLRMPISGRKIMNITTATAKGARPYQEDTFINLQISQGTLLGVFDGHGGPEASEWMAKNFDLYFQYNQRNVEVGLRDTFDACAAALRGYEAGTTASVVFIPTDSTTVYTAVIGDSPIIIDTLDGLWYGPDHNVRTNPKELEAATARGGYYSGGYICKGSSGLQMGRALGDAYLALILSTEPEISKLETRKFILIATDGLFDPAHHNFKEAAEGVLAQIELGANAQSLVDRAVALPTHDNVTAILVRL
jgi:serine/threonine protein phosphatase PrpC